MHSLGWALSSCNCMLFAVLCLFLYLSILINIEPVKSATMVSIQKLA